MAKHWMDREERWPLIKFDEGARGAYVPEQHGWIAIELTDAEVERVERSLVEFEAVQEMLADKIRAVDPLAL